MSETEDAASVSEPRQAVFADQAGALLRAAREAQGLHIGALAVALKVPVKKLEALEAGRYDELPDMVFARSLAMSVCRTLKISPEAVLAALPGAQVHRIQSASTGLNTEFKSTDGGAHFSLRAQLTSPLGLGAIVLLLGVVVVTFWPETSPVVGTASAPISTAGTAVSAVQEPTAVEPSSPLSPVQTAPAEAIAASVPAPLPDALEITAHGVSWVEVLDADAAPLLRKLTVDGEVLRVGGKLPLTATVGRADQLTVQVKGQFFDLAPLARDNVARFEVK